MKDPAVIFTEFSQSENNHLNSILLKILLK